MSRSLEDGNDARDDIPEVSALRLTFLAIAVALFACASIVGCGAKPTEMESTRAEVSPTDWQKLEAGDFYIYAPPSWKFHKLQGIDSYVGEFVGGGARLEFDYGQYSNTLDEHHEAGGPS